MTKSFIYTEALLGRSEREDPLPSRLSLILHLIGQGHTPTLRLSLTKENGTGWGDSRFTAVSAPEFILVLLFPVQTTGNLLLPPALSYQLV